MAVNFDKIAPVYDQLARMVFGNALRKSQLCTLRFIPESATVLILGGGTGWFLKSLLQQKQVKKIVYVEASAAMLDLSRKKMATETYAAEIEYRLGTEQSIRAYEKFDVVITHFVFDLFPEQQVKMMIHILYHTLHQNGVWLCSDFVLARQHSGRWWKKRLVSAMYIFFRWVSGVEARTLPDIAGLLASFSLHCESKVTFYHGLIQAMVYRKLNQSKAIGIES
jgi:tRNA (cmo5U34)-methyltransferase